MQNVPNIIIMYRNCKDGYTSNFLHWLSFFKTKIFTSNNRDTCNVYIQTQTHMLYVHTIHLYILEVVLYVCKGANFSSL